MTREQLRVELNWFCGCGNPEDAAATLLKVLQMHPLYDHRSEFEALIPDRGLEYLLLYLLDEKGWFEHGGTIGGQWLTERGEAVKAALGAEQKADGFEALLGDHCMAAGDPIGWTSADRPV
jgi:hypothetical protein